MNGIALAEDLQAAEIIVNQIHRFTMHPPKTETRMEDTLFTKSLVYRRNQKFSQANPRGMFYHDQRTGVATTPTACVGGDYSGGVTAPGYIIQQPAARQYLAPFQDDISQIICTLKLPVLGDPTV